MSIYRPPKRQWPYTFAYCVVALLAGLLLGMAIFGGEKTSQSDVAGDVKAALSSARSNLEVAEIEYRESVSNGKVVREPEYRGALAALSRSRSRLTEVKEILEVMPLRQTAPFDAQYAAVARSMKNKAEPAEVGGQIDELSRALGGGR